MHSTEISYSTRLLKGIFFTCLTELIALLLIGRRKQVSDGAASAFEIKSSAVQRSSNTSICIKCTAQYMMYASSINSLPFPCFDCLCFPVVSKDSKGWGWGDLKGGEREAKGKERKEKKRRLVSIYILINGRRRRRFDSCLH